MDTLINLYAGATGLWKRVAAFLPLLSGAGMVLAGGGAILVHLGHAASAADLVRAVEALGPTDPNVLLISGGLTLLGIHTNHNENAAALAAPKDPPAA